MNQAIFISFTNICANTKVNQHTFSSDEGNDSLSNANLLSNTNTNNTSNVNSDDDTESKTEKFIDPIPESLRRVE